MPPRPRPLRHPGLAALCLFLSGAASAQLTPLGDEFEVNTWTTGDQGAASVEILDSGDFVVAWTSDGSSGDDDSLWSAQARRFAPDGTPLGADFQVNLYTTGDQGRPVVARAAHGGFVVIWVGAGSWETDTSASSIHGLRFDAGGEPRGDEFQVNTWTTSHQWADHLVASDARGDFVVTWASWGSYGSDSSAVSIQAQRFDRHARPRGGELQVNRYTTGAQLAPAVAADAGGNFVVVWTSEGGSGGTDTSFASIQGQRFDRDGTPLGDEFQVNTYTTGHQWQPAVASDGAGNFLVVWTSQGSSGTDQSNASVHAQRYAPDGTPLGGEFQVNTYTTDYQGTFTGATSEDGDGFTVVWQSRGAAGTDTDLYSIQARRFAPDGTPLGAELQVNTWTTGDQVRPAIASDPRGHLVIAWESPSSPGSDTSGYSVHARRFATAFFFDGFETADTTRWSATQP
jgi:hypothetical protein